MSNEMQFADPDWKPTRPLSGNTQGQTFTPQPINEPVQTSAPEAEAVHSAEYPGYEEGYASRPVYHEPMREAPRQPTPVAPFSAPRMRYRRRRSPWLWIIVIILIFGFMSGGFGSLFGTKDSVENKAITFNGIPTILLQEDNGNIQIKSDSTDGQIHIRADKKASFFDDPNNIKVTYNTNTTDNTITINVDTGGNGFSSREVDFIIDVPQSTNLQLQTTSGDISVEGMHGQASLKTTSGNVSTSNDTFAAGSVLNATSGNIDTSQDVFNGGVNIQTTSGDINLEQDTLGGSSQFQTTSGNIQFDGTINANGQYHFTTTSGDIDVTLPSTTNFHVDATTYSGSIDARDYPTIQLQDTGSGSQASGDVGTSLGISLQLQAGSGDITLHQGA
jgi:DUF4097 and DUF4098 domain-containing protein YvlB